MIKSEGSPWSEHRPTIRGSLTESDTRQTFADLFFTSMERHYGRSVFNQQLVYPTAQDLIFAGRGV